MSDLDETGQPIVWRELHRITDPTGRASIVLSIWYDTPALTAAPADPDCDPIIVSPVTRADLQALLDAYPDGAE